MAERTITVVCRDCGTTFDHITRSNRPKLLCATCVREAQRKATREHKRRERAAARVEYKDCPHCGVEYDKPRKRPGRCAGCRKAHLREYLKQYRVAHAGQPRQFFCTICGAKINRAGNSGKPLYCPPCAETAARSARLRAEAKRTERRAAKLATHCYHCGDELPRPYYPGKYPARCFTCKRQRHYAYKRAATAEGRATARCTNCGSPVEPGRRGQRLARCSTCRRVRRLEQQRAYAGMHGHFRRARIRGADAEKFTKESIFDRDGWRCALCNRKIQRRLKHPHPLSASLDHTVPLSRGGTHTRANVRAAHLRCNLKKHARIENVQLMLFG
ncbi:HNH endonuclease signature motif containing protein [Micromonospora sp. NPDC006766]|uniref:HNH endonuclease n=1 Tax=Micromonospora sp. NPDC006766 TaxID=3154778 RepID=UPI0033F2D889